MRIIITAALAASLMPTRIAAQDCGYFGNDTCSSGFHYVWGTPENNKNAHSHCEGACAPGVACHPVCNPELLDANPETRAAFEAAFAAANAGDVATVLRLASRLPAYVAFNPERRALQLRSCSGAYVAASLPVEDADQLVAASRLISTRRLLADAREKELRSSMK